MSATGVWTERAKKVIRDVFDRLPFGATRVEAEKALRAAYPFGPRENHPYKVWLREQRLALERWYGEGPTKKCAAAHCRLRFVEGRLKLDVYCPDTGMHPRHGSACIGCGRYADAMRALAGNEELQALLRGVDVDDPFIDPLLDWLLEHDIEAVPHFAVPDRKGAS